MRKDDLLYLQFFLTAYDTYINSDQIIKIKNRSILNSFNSMILINFYIDVSII